MVCLEVLFHVRIWLLLLKHVFAAKEAASGLLTAYQVRA